MNSDHWISVLETEPTPDLWSDVDLLPVSQALDALDDASWQKLTADLMQRSEGFRRRLAQTQLYSGKPRATEILGSLLRSPEISVGLMAAEMLLEKDYNGMPVLTLRAELQRHLAQAPPHAREPLERMLGRAVA